MEDSPAFTHDPNPGPMNTIYSVNPESNMTAWQFVPRLFTFHSMFVGLWFGWIFVKRGWRIKLTRYIHGQIVVKGEAAFANIHTTIYHGFSTDTIITRSRFKGFNRQP